MKLILKKILILLITILLFFFHFSFAFAAIGEPTDKPTLVSKAAILMDNKTGKILYEKNANEKMYPASTTKIMTAILTLENCNLNDVVTVSYDAIKSIPEGYSIAYLQPDEQLTVEQLLQLTLVISANDAANVLAEHVGGSIESFVSMMNTKVNELGLSNTHFTNSFGMHDENHYTTAQDLAMIMAYCMKNESFRKLAGSASCAIPATNKYGTRTHNSTNALIVPTSSNYYRYLTAGKTGYTSQAGDCFVSCSYKDDLELICVILGGTTVNGTSTRFSETRILYDYGYDNFSIKTLLNENDIVTHIEVPNGTNDSKSLDLLANKSISTLLGNSMSKGDIPFEISLNENIKAPIENGDILGSVSYVIDGIKYESNLIASHSVEESKLLLYVFEIGIVFLILIFICKICLSKKKRNF